MTSTTAIPQMRYHQDWLRAQAHHQAWWRREGLVLSPLNRWPVDGPARGIDPVPAERDATQLHTDATWLARRDRYEAARRTWLGDSLPVAYADRGTVSVAAYLGAEATWIGSDTTIWYEHRKDAPETWGRLRFNPQHRWVRTHRELYQACVAVAGDDYAIGMPGIGSNIEVLAALRGAEDLWLDLHDRPAWIEEKLWEINEVFQQAFDLFHGDIRLADGSCCSSYFELWGPGRTSLITLDPVAMISEQDFRRFVVPPLAAQCEWLDCCMVHVDGSAAERHIDSLLEIPGLDAIEFTPDPEPDGNGGMVNRGGRACHIPLYRRILAAGKAVQVINATDDEVLPLLDALGGKGLHIQFRTRGADRARVEEILTRAEAYR